MNQNVRKYKCLKQPIFESAEYQLVPIRDEDKFQIMHWRNAQLNILRQKEPLTKEKQAWYFENIVSKLFEEEKPPQLLFSFLKNEELIGYGGLVHIDWESKNGEISFLTDKIRADHNNTFTNDWNIFLQILKIISFDKLHFCKIYTYAYSIRNYLFPILEQNGFQKEAFLKDHKLINGVYEDVYIHSLFNLKLTKATTQDAETLFHWRNEENTRLNSFSSEPVKWEDHINWLNKKISDENVRIFILLYNDIKIGQIRLEIDNETANINYLIDIKFRGKGFGKSIIRLAENWCKNQGISSTYAEVKNNNFASIKIFESLNYKGVTENMIIKFSKSLSE